MKKHLQIQLSKINRARTAVGVGLATLAGMAHAEIPTEVTTKLSAIPADVAAIGALVLIAVGAIFAFKLLRRAL